MDARLVGYLDEQQAVWKVACLAVHWVVWTACQLVVLRAESSEQMMAAWWDLLWVVVLVLKMVDNWALKRAVHLGLLKVACLDDQQAGL